MYVDSAKQTSYKLETAHNFFLHAVIGCCLTKPHAPYETWDDPTTDYRVHTLLIRPSGSGKAPVYSMAENLAINSDLKFRTQTNMTEAGLLGTVSKTGRDIITTYGDGYYYDIIGYTEASNLFTPKSHSRTLITSLNTLLDEKREVYRRLAYGNLEYHTNVTLMLTTFPNPLVYTQLQSGFMQRCFVLYEQIGLEVYKEISKYLNEIVWRPQREVNLQPLTERLKQIKNKNFNFKTNGKVREAMNKVVDDYAKLVVSFQDVQKEVLKTFMTRQTVLLHKLMCHHASLELREKLNVQDVQYAKLLCIASYRSICKYIKDHYKRDPRYERVENLIFRLKEKGHKKMKLSPFTARLRPLTVSEVEEILKFEKDLVQLKGKWLIFK